MTINHKDIVDPDIHEPKGIGSASASTVYKADGAGAGSWVKITSGMVDASSIKNVNTSILNTILTDVSTASDVYIVVPFACTVTKCYSALQATINTADSVVTLKIGATPMTGGTMTITASGSAPGDIDSCTPTANNTLTAGQVITIDTDGGSTGTAALVLTFVLSLS